MNKSFKPFSELALFSGRTEEKEQTFLDKRKRARENDNSGWKI
jgi:hypothetical protein